jgi:preprotein translocase subunit YajC
MQPELIVSREMLASCRSKGIKIKRFYYLLIFAWNIIHPSQEAKTEFLLRIYLFGGSPMRSAIALLVALAVSLPSFGAPQAPTQDEIKKQVSKLKTGTKVTIRLLSKGKVKGIVTAVNDREIALAVQQNKQESKRSIPIDQIKELSTPTPTWLLATLIGVGAAVLVIAIVFGVTYAHNE